MCRKAHSIIYNMHGTYNTYNMYPVRKLWSDIVSFTNEVRTRVQDKDPPICWTYFRSTCVWLLHKYTKTQAMQQNTPLSNQDTTKWTSSILQIDPCRQSNIEEAVLTPYSPLRIWNGAKTITNLESLVGWGGQWGSLPIVYCQFCKSPVRRLP